MFWERNVMWLNNVTLQGYSRDSAGRIQIRGPWAHGSDRKETVRKWETERERKQCVNEEYIWAQQKDIIQELFMCWFRQEEQRYDRITADDGAGEEQREEMMRVCVGDGAQSSRGPLIRLVSRQPPAGDDWCRPVCVSAWTHTHTHIIYTSLFSTASHSLCLSPVEAQ